MPVSWLDNLAALRGASQLRHIQTPDPYTRRKGLGDYALGIGIGMARPVLAGLSTVGDILSRPVTALSEGYGAAEEDKDVLEAALRGLKKGPSKAKYPSFGERLVPEEEGEGVGRKVARIGAEILTDPTTYVGPGIVKGVIGGGIKGAKFAGATRLGKPLVEAGEALARSGASQALARTFGSLEAQAGFFGKTPGKRLAKSAAKVEAEFLRRTSRAEAKLVEAAEGLSDAQRAAGYELYKSGKLWQGLSTGDKGADRLAKHYDRVIKARGAEAYRFRDRYGNSLLMAVPEHLAQPAQLANLKKRFTYLGKAKGLDYLKAQRLLVKKGRFSKSEAAKIIRGELKPFEPITNVPYSPQMILPEYLKGLGDESKLAAASKALLEDIRKARGQGAEDIAEQFRISPKEAENFLRTQAGFVKKAGPLEYIRQMVLPEELLERDPVKILSRYDQQFFRRLGSAKEFGVHQRRLENLVNRSIVAGLNQNTGKLLRNSVLGVRDPSWLDNIAPSILGWQVITKMGPTSSISNLPQRLHAYIAHGAGSYARAQMRLARDPVFRKRAMLAASQQLKEQMDKLIGKATIGEKVGRFPRLWLRGVGFNWTETGNRVQSYATGVLAAEDAARASKGVLTPRLQKMGLNQKDLDLFMRRGKWTPFAQERIGLKAGKDLQFTTSYLDLPPLWQSQAGRVIFQYKSFIHQQTRFLVREIMKPAIKYFETGGKEGSIGPLMRAMVAYPIAGQGVAAMRELMQEQTAQAIGAKRKKQRKFDYEHPVAQMLKDSLYVGSFGMAGDILTQASRGNLLGWAAGPTVTDVTENLEFLGRNAMKGQLPRTEDVVGRAYRHMPFRRLLPLDPQEIATARIDRAGWR